MIYVGEGRLPSSSTVPRKVWISVETRNRRVHMLAAKPLWRAASHIKGRVSDLPSVVNYPLRALKKHLSDFVGPRVLSVMSIMMGFPSLSSIDCAPPNLQLLDPLSCLPSLPSDPMLILPHMSPCVVSPPGPSPSSVHSSSLQEPLSLPNWRTSRRCDFLDILMVRSATLCAIENLLLQVQVLVSEVSAYPYFSHFVWSCQFAATRVLNLLAILSCAGASQTNRDGGT
jgi:hypothetical protein